MNTVVSILVGIVAAMVIITSFLTIRLAVKNSRAAARTIPAGGATAPPATTTWTKIKDFGCLHFDKVRATVSAMIVVWMIIYLFDHIFPPVSKVYLRLGGPHYELLTIATVAFAFIALIPVGKTRTTLLSIASLLTALGILFYLVPAVQEVAGGSSSSSPVHTASTGRVASQAPDPCDNVYRKYSLTKEPVRIVAAKDCLMGWDVLQGEVVLVGPGGVESRPITSSNPLPGFHGVKWRSHGATALVEARFYR